jgi:predicted Zn-dependent protease
MLTRDHAQSVFDKLRRYSSADEVELLISGGQSSLTRFANNTIHQNVSEESYHISVRASFGAGSVSGGRTARASTNKHDDDSLRRVMRAAEALAKVQQPDPDLLPMPAQQEGREHAFSADPINRFFEATAKLSPGQRAEGVERIVNVAAGHELTTAGIYSNSEMVEGIFNSRGLSDWHEETLGEISITMLDKSSSGWQKANAPDVELLDPALLAEVAAQKAVESADPRELPPGKYTVILEPSAVLDIVGFMFWDFSGSALLEQRSFLNDRMGTQLFGENITIWDDVYHPLQTGVPFDGEGMTRHRVKLVDRGVPKALVYARSSAARMRKSALASGIGEIYPTGHGFSLPNELGEAPLNIVFASPQNDNAQSVEQMIAGTEKGLLVTRLWYIREVDPYEKIMTGMTRDGTFLVENGKVCGGVRNFRFNQSLIHMLRNVAAIGDPVRSCGEESIDMVAPPMKVLDFNFTETTKF